MSDTPIFDQLARERGYDRLVAVQPPRFGSFRMPDSGVGATGSIRGSRPVGMYIDEWNGGQTDESVNAAPTINPIPVTTLADLAKGTQQE